MKDSLAVALTDLARVAAEAGADVDTALEEGRVLAAAVAEPAVGAFVDWCRETGYPTSAETFMLAATQGRRYRTSPTATLTWLRQTAPDHAGAYAQALADVCSSACTLGEPSAQVTGAASMAAAAQLGGTSTPITVPTVPGTPVLSSGNMDQPPADFSQRAPGILQQVLGQLKRSQENLRNTPLSVTPLPDTSWLTDSHAPGAFDLGGLNTPTNAPGAPNAPVEGGIPGQASSAPQTDAASTGESEPKPASPETPAKSLEELMAELDALIGLKGVKEEIKRQAAILRVESLRSKEGLKSPTITRHLIFVGNPGTGKTTVARLVAGIYRALGLLSKGQLVEVDRSELVAGYLGQTAIKTAEMVKKAEGGVLFIDEAYSLNGDQYGEEAINTLVKEMEDKRDNLVVIVAGYPDPMQVFIANNPGLNSRFRTTIEFEDYTDDEVVNIFTYQADQADYDLGEGTEARFRHLLGQQLRNSTFGNGRFARNTLEAAIGRHAWRLRDEENPTLEQLRTLLPDDVTVEPETVEWPAASPSDEIDKTTPPSNDDDAATPTEMDSQ